MPKPPVSDSLASSPCQSLQARQRGFFMSAPTCLTSHGALTVLACEQCLTGVSF